MHHVVGVDRRENFGALLWQRDLRVGKHHHDIHGLTFDRLSERRSIVSKGSNLREIWHNFYSRRITPDTHNAPCKPRDCAVSTQALASVPKAHTNALRVSQPGGGRPSQPQESSTMGSHKGREGQGARKVYQDRRLASPLTTWFTVLGERYS